MIIHCIVRGVCGRCNCSAMKLLVVLPVALVLASLVSALPSDPRTNKFASSDHYSPRDDARMNENRGLHFEGPQYTDPVKNSRFPTGGGRLQDIPQGFSPGSNNNANRQPTSDYRPQNNPQGPPPNNPQGPPQNNPQGPPQNNPQGPLPGGDSAPSLPGIRPHSGTMDSHLIPRPPTSGFTGNPSGFPIGPSSDPDQPAFEGCERHTNAVIAQQTRGRYETLPQPVKHNSHIALYPMTDDNHALYVKVLMPSMQYKAKIQGTNMMLQKCHSSGFECQIEDEASTKSNNLIQPQQWNYMYSQISDGKITIGIGPMTKVMTMSNIPAVELDNAEWIISSGDEPMSTEADAQGTNGGPFMMEFPCAEYVAQHLSTTEMPQDPRTDDGSFHGPGYTAPQMGYTTEPTKSGMDGHSSSSDNTAAIVVGVVVALLLIALVVAIAISIHRKRSFKVNESTPLSDKKKSATAASQEQQQPQQSQHHEVELHDEK